MEGWKPPGEKNWKPRMSSRMPRRFRLRGADQWARGDLRVTKVVCSFRGGRSDEPEIHNHRDMGFPGSDARATEQKDEERKGDRCTKLPQDAAGTSRSRRRHVRRRPHRRELDYRTRLTRLLCLRKGERRHGALGFSARRRSSMPLKTSRWPLLRQELPKKHADHRRRSPRKDLTAMRFVEKVRWMPVRPAFMIRARDRISAPTPENKQSDQRVYFKQARGSYSATIFPWCSGLSLTLRVVFKPAVIRKICYLIPSSLF